MFGVGRNLEAHPAPTPSGGQGCPLSAQAAQGPVQLGLECLQGWGAPCAGSGHAAEAVSPAWGSVNAHGLLHTALSATLQHSPRPWSTILAQALVYHLSPGPGPPS